MTKTFSPPTSANAPRKETLDHATPPAPFPTHQESTARTEPLVIDGYENDELPPQISTIRRLFKDRRLMAYNRLVVLVVVSNMAVAAYGLTAGSWWSTGNGFNLAAIGNTAIVNLTVAILIRQQHVVNLLFKVATAAPTSWPLRVRWTLGKIYHFGGIHVGGAIAGTIWFAAFLGGIGYHYAADLPGVSGALVAISVALLALLVAMIGFSLPRFRAAYHDRFELVHRFGGWTSLLLFWIHTALFAAANNADGSVLSALIGSLGFWLLALVTTSVVLPWLELKKVPVEITRPSDHVALVNFDYGVTPFAGSSTAVSRSPLTEWHSFANVPSPGKEGYRLTISRAGDWTGDFIDETPSHLWVKGIPTAGVGNIDKLFKRVVWVATGSGIGPALPHLLSQEVPAHLVWATRDPRKTYGDQLVDEILAVQPHATIWNTQADGKPDMVKLANRAVQEFDAEAVICISNKKLTWLVVEGMERVGVPAFGAIWDS